MITLKLTARHTASLMLSGLLVLLVPPVPPVLVEEWDTAEWVALVWPVMGSWGLTVRLLESRGGERS